MEQKIQSDVPINADRYGINPAFGAEIVYASLIDAKMQHIKPRILVEAHKGFFLADDIWTCYRRNYFSVRCQFELKPNPQGTLCLVVEQRFLPVGQFHVTLTAKTASTNDIPSTPVKLLQHTLKPDNVTEVGFCELAPLNGGNSLALSREHTFEKVQFKLATANNGRRRAPQQFFTLVLELWCNVIGCDRYKIAERVSAPIVVRGRSPGHFHFPVVPQHHQYASPGLDLGGSPPADPVQIHRPQANHIKLREFQTSGQYSVESASAEDRYYDTSSISSSSDVFSRRSVATSITSLGGSADLSDFVVSLLLDDEGIKNLCTDGFYLLNPDKFERHLRRTLKTFAKHLALDSPGKSSKDLGYFLRRRVAALARNIRELVHTLGDPVSQISQVLKAISVEQYDDDKDCGSEVDLDDSDLDHEGDGEEVKFEADAFNSIKAKIISSNSFEILREDLLDFVVPFMLNGEMKRQDVQKLQIRYSYTNLSNKRAAAIFSKQGHRTTSHSTWFLVSWWFEFRWLEQFVIKLRHFWTKVHRPKVESGYVRREFTCVSYYGYFPLQFCDQYLCRMTAHDITKEVSLLEHLNTERHQYMIGSCFGLMLIKTISLVLGMSNINCQICE